MDGDDWVEQDLLEECWNVLKSERLDIVMFGYAVDNLNKQGKTISSNEVNPNKIIFSFAIKRNFIFKLFLKRSSKKQKII